MITAKSKLFPVEFWVASGVVFLYVILRAWKISFCIDEAFSFSNFVLDSYRAIISYRVPDANNHVLNSMAMKMCSGLFGSSELSLRLANVLSFPVYAVFAWLLLCDLKDRYLHLAAFVVLTINPFLLDFFSVARGYGMSEAMMMASMYYLVQLLRQRLYYLQPAALFFISGTLAVLCNFTLLSWFVLSVALAAARMLYLIITQRYQWKMYTTAFFSGFLLVLPPLVYLSFILRKLFKAGVLGYGGDTGFWTDTVSSLVNGALYGQPYASFLEWPVKVGVVLALVFSVILTIILFVRKRYLLRRYSQLWISLSLILMLFISIELQHMLMGSPFVIQRTALFFVPLFSLMCIYLLATLMQYRQQYRIIVFLAAFVAVAHFCFAANIHYVYIWKFDADTKQAMHDLENFREKSKSQHIVLQPYWKQVSSADFYRFTKNYTWLKPIKSLGTASEVDFTEDYYYWPKDSLYLFHGHPLQLLKSYPLSGMLLLRNRQKLSHDTLAYDSKIFRNILLQPHAFSESICIPAAGLPKDTTLKISTVSRVQFRNEWKQGELAVSVSGNGRQVFWQSYRFRNYLFQKRGVMNVLFECGLPKLSADDSIRVFIWNTGDGDMKAEKLQAAVMRR
jgi:hypothetical protein